VQFLLSCTVGVWVVPSSDCATNKTTFCQAVGNSEFVCSYQYLPSTSTCRPGNGPCNPAETCSGSDAECPADVVLPNCPPTCPTTGLPSCVNRTTGERPDPQILEQSTHQRLYSTFHEMSKESNVCLCVQRWLMISNICCSWIAKQNLAESYRI